VSVFAGQKDDVALNLVAISSLASRSPPLTPPKISWVADL